MCKDMHGACNQVQSNECYNEKTRELCCYTCSKKHTGVRGNCLMMIYYIKCVHSILLQVVMSEYPKSSLLYFGVWEKYNKIIFTILRLVWKLV